MDMSLRQVLIVTLFQITVDLDSDNDGILDAIEAGFTDADNDGEVDGNGTGVDADGKVIASDGHMTLRQILIVTPFQTI